MSTKIGTGVTFPDGTTQATAATSSVLGVVGYGQTWQDVTSSRSVPANAVTKYTNSTGRTIVAIITLSINTNSNNYGAFYIDDILVGGSGQPSAASSNKLLTTTLIIPAGSTYNVKGWPTGYSYPSLWKWVELR